MAQRFASAHVGTPLGDDLATVSAEIEDDLRTLDTLIERLGHRPSRWKMAAAGTAELIGRLKLNGRLRRRSPLSPLLELEVLSAGILTKESLWTSLSMIGDEWPELASADLAELHHRAEHQRQLLDAHRAQIVRGALADR